MPRPARKAAARKVTYKDTDSEEESTPSSSSDEDDDFDPDKVTIPGGGTNVQSLANVKKEVKPSAVKTDPGNSKPVYNLKTPINPQLMQQQLLAKGLVSKTSTVPTAESLTLNSMLGAAGSMSSFPQSSPQLSNMHALIQQMVKQAASDPRAINGMFNMPMNPSIYQNPMLGNPYGMPYPYGMSNPYFMGQDYKGGMLSGMMGMEEPKEEDEDDEEELGHTETFADYMPTKLKIGIKHPDSVVETASLASVSHPDVYYRLSLPEDIIHKGKLSALQLEAVVYACQQHEKFLPSGERAGYLIGDGAGVGKGRTIAGIIYENYLKGRKKAIWVSVSSDLKYDSERDLKDIGAKIDVYALNKMKYAKIQSPVNGNVKKGVMYLTYSSLIGESQSTGGKFRTRIKQLVHWAGDNFDGVIVFDECHRAKNLCPVGGSKPTKTGTLVAELQKQLPTARVVYASATGASEPKNMAYMIRLGIWGEGSAFNEFQDFISSVEKRGVGAMEIVAMDMKLRGTYIARQLSFHGVSFKVEEVPLAEDFIKMYNDSVKLWVEAREKFQKALSIMDVEGRMSKTMWGQFWSSHQRFFKYLCIAAKVRHVVRLATDAVKMGKCIVIGLQSTGEARTMDQLEKDDGELSDFVSTAKGVFETLIEKHFPAPDRSKLTRILGLENSSQFMKDLLNEMKNGDDGGGAGSSSHKRKPERAAKSKAAKRVKVSKVKDSDSESDRSADDDDKSEAGSGCDSDFCPSGSGGSESYASETSSSDGSSNPFEDDSDADEPWLGGKKKKASSKKEKKKPKPQFKKKLEPKRPPPSKDAVETAVDMKAILLKKLDVLSETLPPNTLDELIDELGGPDNVSEMTGRKGRVVQEGGQVKYESRSECDIPLELLNIKEKERFMNGEKDIAIISEAASSGISLQSDRRVKNQRRRVHITLELPWSADRAIQQFGRTHRSNQVNAPEYVFLISDLAGERRFASIVAKRLESLGALTHGDRRATESRDLSRFNIDNKYGRTALETTMKTIMEYEQPMVPPPKDYKGNFFKDCQNALIGVGLIIPSEQAPYMLSLDKDYNNISKFLNRILGLPVVLQNSLFQYFTDVLSAIVSQAKKMGRYDLGILDLGSASGDKVRRLKLYTFLGKHATGTATTELHQVQVERGMSWSESEEKSKELSGDEGYYISYQVRNGKQNAILAVCSEIASPTKKKKDSDRMFTLYRPNTGLQVKQESFSDLKKKYKKVDAEQAEPHWTEQYEASTKTCSHAYWRGNCRKMTLGMECEIGLRTRNYHLLSGSVLNVWTQVESVLSSIRSTPQAAKMQVIRVRTNDGLKIVGTLIPNNAVETLMEVLKQNTEFSETIL